MIKLIISKPVYYYRFAIAAVCALLCSQSNAQTDTLSLSLQQTEQQFLEKNLTILAGNFNVDVNRALIEQAKLWDNPILTTDQNIFADGKFMGHGKTINGQQNGQVFIQIQQLIKTAGKRNKLVTLATTTSELSELQLRQVMQNLKYQLRKDYYTISHLLSIEKINNQELEQTQQLLKGMEAQLKAGNIAQKDYLRIQALSIALQQDINENISALYDAETELKILLQAGQNTFIKPSDPLEFGSTITALPDMISTAKVNNAGYLLQQKQVVYQQQNLTYQTALKSPDITLGPEYDRASNYAPNYFGLTVSLPLPILNKNQGSIKAAEISIKQEQTTFKLLETTLENNISNAYNKLLLSNKQNNNVQREFYSQYQKMFNNMILSYQQRQLSLLEFIDFFDAYKETNLRALQLQLSLQLAKEELNFLTGTDVIK